MRHPFLIGNRIYLRGLEKEDMAGNYFQWFNDQIVSGGNSHGFFPNNMNKMEAYLDKVHSDSSIIVFAVVLRNDDIHIGNISLQCIDWISRSAEYAIIIGEKDNWGKGLAKEASDLIMMHGFNNLNLHRIYCGTTEENVGMQKLADYMGMKKEGVRRQAYYKDGKYADIIEYGVLKDEYLQNVKKK